MFENHQLFENPLKNAFYIAYQHLAIVLSLMSNGTLVALILKSDRKEFGAYRYLLLTFAVVDVYYGLVYFVIQPIPEAWSNVCYMAAHGKLAVAYYATAHSHSFVILVFHFLYRLLAIKGSPRTKCFSQEWFIAFIIGCCAAIGGSWFIVMYWLHDMDEFVLDYMRPILRNHSISSLKDINAYSVAVYWKYGTFDGPRWRPILGISIMSTTMVAAYTFVMYAACSIRYHTRENAAVRSKKTSDLTAQLMRALTYQTLLPLLTAYSPPLISVVVPFFGLYFPYIADISPLLCGLHPILDGCMLIYTIKAYRHLLLRWLRCDQTTREHLKVPNSNHS